MEEVTLSETSPPNSFLKKIIAKIKNSISSVISFVKNRGITDTNVIKEINTLAEKQKTALFNAAYESLDSNFRQAIDKKTLEKVANLIDLKNALTAAEKKLSSIFLQSKAPDLQKKIEDLKRNIPKKENNLHTKNRRKLLAALREVRILREDPEELKAAKNRLQEEEKETLEEIKFLMGKKVKPLLALRFAEIVDIRTIHKKTEDIQVPTDFTERVDR